MKQSTNQLIYLRKILDIVRWALTVIAIAWIVWLAWSNQAELARAFDSLTFNQILLSQTIVIVGLIPGACVWQKFLSYRHNIVNLGLGILVYLKSSIGKYTPAGILTFLIQTNHLGQFGFTTFFLIKVFLSTAVSACLAAAVLAAPLLITFTGQPYDAVWIFIAFLLCSIFFLIIHLVRGVKIVSWALNQLNCSSTYQLFVNFCFMILAWAITGIHLMIITTDTSAGPIFFISVYAFSAFAGFLFSIFPGAFGARDGAIIAGLSQSIPLVDAIFVGLVSRIFVVIADLIGWIVSSIFLSFDNGKNLKLMRK